MGTNDEHVLGEDETTLAISRGDNAWSDITAEDIAHIGRIMRVTLLPMGTRNGNASVEVLIQTSEGELVHANTTWALWDAATMIMNRWRIEYPNG